MADRRSGFGRTGRAPAGGGHGVASLVGGGPSLVGPVGAMRARDASRPREADVARAEKTVVIRRRAADVPPAAVVAAVDGPVDQSSEGDSEPRDS